MDKLIYIDGEGGKRHSSKNEAEEEGCAGRVYKALSSSSKETKGEKKGRPKKTKPSRRRYCTITSFDTSLQSNRNPLKDDIYVAAYEYVRRERVY